MADKMRCPSTLLLNSVTLPRYVDAFTLAANVAETYTVPSGIQFILISGDTGFYINTNGAAAVPADTTNGSASFYIPSAAQFVVEAGDSFSVMATAISHVTIAGYSR